MRKQPVFSTLLKKDHLAGIQRRMLNDVEPYMKLIDDFARNGKTMGVWSLARMLFPIIESVAEVIYPRHGADRSPESKLLKQLGIRCPVLVWHMYRNSLMHNDCLQRVLYRKQEISWSISASGSAYHTFKNNQIHIDIKRLYSDLKSFLSLAIDQADPDETIELQTAVNLFDPLKPAIQNELFTVNQPS
ncbi:MAG: hypothetical protein KC649_07240, partial [Candidatus Omnitrophica bacterium]|nr:hypothetical protein [Candidatus Omnitrophota bacterium]